MRITEEQIKIMQEDLYADLIQILMEDYHIPNRRL